jgi:anthranilate synthase/aminodeoxychorismate synthase-like glutamine amidotransferase
VTADPSPFVVVIDNYDSFTFNLVQCMRSLGARVLVLKNDRVTARDVCNLRPSGVLLSPGPGAPSAAGQTPEIVRELGQCIPMLGVCLGHQVIAACFGARVVRAETPMHGKVSLVRHDERALFHDLPQPFPATRYHSLVVDPKELPACLEASAWSESAEIMGFCHRELRLQGVQFHPESILTPDGPRLMQNWLSSL